MGTTYKEAIFCGNMAGKCVAFSNAVGTNILDITTADANGPVRIDSIGATIDDTVQNTLSLYAHDGTSAYPLAAVPLARPVKSAVNNSSVTFAWAATTITRSAGSFLADGYKVGDMPIVTGCPDTANNLDGTKAITALTDTVMTIGTASMTTRAACYGVATIALADTRAATNILTAANMAPFVCTDAAGNKFLELPQGWKLQAAVASALNGAKTLHAISHWGAYAGA